MDNYYITIKIFVSLEKKIPIYIVSFRRAAGNVFGDSLFKYRRTPWAKVTKYSSQSRSARSIQNFSASTFDNVLASACVLLLWNFHSVKMKRSNSFKEFQTFVCKRTNIGRPPATRVIASSI